MYHSHFGLESEPFGVTPDPRFLKLGEQHNEALAALYYSMAQRRGFAVLLGAPGVGKTSTLVRLQQLLNDGGHVAFFVHPQIDPAAFLQTVLLTVGLTPDACPVARHRQLHTFLAHLQSEGKSCVIIIDEAQHLSPSTLEAVRMLSNFETPREKLIQFVLAGQPALADVLADHACEQIAQRISVIARLHAMKPAEVGEYVSHRLSVAGRSRPLFSASALRMLAQASSGIPRNINAICFNTLTLAFSRRAQVIDETLLAEALMVRALTGPAASQPPVPVAARYIEPPAAYLPRWQALLVAGLATLLFWAFVRAGFVA